MSPGWALCLVALWTLYGVAGAEPPLTAQEGEDVTLPCTFNHIPGIKLQRLNITWKMQRAEGAALLVHSYYGQLDLWWGQDKAYRSRTQLYPEGIRNGNASLTLRAVCLQDEGSYLCYVTSELGTWSQTISLAVLRESEVASPIVARPGQDITLNCLFKCRSKLQPLTITWQKEAAEGPDLLVHSYDNGMNQLQSQAVTYRDRTQLHPERFPQGNASLTLRDVRTQDQGIYICHIKLEQGQFAVRMQVTIEGSGSDLPPPVVYIVILCLLPLLLLFIIYILIKKYHPSLLCKLKTFQFGSMWKEQEGQDQPESNPLTAREIEEPNTPLPPPASPSQVPGVSGQACGAATPRCCRDSGAMECGARHSPRSLDPWPKEHEEGGAVPGEIWEALDLLSEGEIAELKAAVAGKSPLGLEAALQEVGEAVRSKQLHVAVIGETGSGKSTFVNATRGLTDESPGAAQTGVVRQTVKPTPYSHPKHPNVILWDLPGVGLENCPSDTSLEMSDNTQYNLFIIISGGPYSDTDSRLVAEVRRQGKAFYFVRSKVDSGVEASQKKNGSEESTLETIRENCTKRLEKENVFLVNSWDPNKFDFPFLQETLAKKFRLHRAQVLQWALSNSTLDMLKNIKVPPQEQT